MKLDSLINLAPPVLQSIVELHSSSDETERELAFWSSIVAFSCLTPKTRFVTNKGKLSACDLYLAVVMPAGSGKSTIEIANRLLEKVHELAISEYYRLLDDYQDVGPIPKPMTVILPSDITKARLIDHFEGQGDEVPMILIETEMDTLFNSMKGSFGGFKSDLRKAYHNEPILSSKKHNNQLVFIKDPRLAVLMSGTANQARRIFVPTEDGFYSRFLIYFKQETIRWKKYKSGLKPFPKELIENLAVEHFQHFVGREVRLDMSYAFSAVNQFGEKQIEAVNSGEEEGHDLVTRHGLMLLKILGVLTCMRAVSTNNRSDVLVPTSEDIALSSFMVHTSLEMSRDLITILEPNVPNVRQISPKHLPQSFTTTGLLKSKGWSTVSRRTLQRNLRKWENEGLIIKKGNGYEKL